MFACCIHRLTVIFGVLSYNTKEKAQYVRHMIGRCVDLVLTRGFRVTVVLYVTDTSALDEVFGGHHDGSLLSIFRSFTAAPLPDDVILDRFVVAAVSLDAGLGSDFAWKARQDFLSNVHTDRNYDLFAFFEDDHDVTAQHLIHFLHWTSCEHLPQSLLLQDSVNGHPSVRNWSAFRQAELDIKQCHRRLPETWLAGFLQYETLNDSRWEDTPEDRMHLLNGALMHNDGYRLYTRGNDKFLVMQVGRSPCFALASALGDIVCLAERPSSGIPRDTKATPAGSSIWLFARQI
jgi:hypothetical protein